MMFNECGNGWSDIIVRLNERIMLYLEDHPELKRQFNFNSVKEKYGGLRVYYYPYNEIIENFIAMAKVEASMTCELCGAPGQMYSDNRITITLCPSCASLKKSLKQAVYTC